MFHSSSSSKDFICNQCCLWESLLFNRSLTHWNVKIYCLFLLSLFPSGPKAVLYHQDQPNVWFRLERNPGWVGIVWCVSCMFIFIFLTFFNTVCAVKWSAVHYCFLLFHSVLSGSALYCSIKLQLNSANCWQPFLLSYSCRSLRLGQKTAVVWFGLTWHKHKKLLNTQVINY